jgi:hypothetical protein
MTTLIGDLIAGTLELLWWLVWEILPIVCYLTGTGLVFAVTLGRVVVVYPKKSDKLHRTWQIGRSPQGRAILSPALGTIVGFSFWVAVLGLAIIVYHYTGTPDTAPPRGSELSRAKNAFCHALNQPCASPVKEK